MKGYVIELKATFALDADSYEEALGKIYDNIDLNDVSWSDSLVETMSESEFRERFSDEDVD